MDDGRGRKLARAQCEPGEDTEGAAPAALHGPEQIGMVARIHHQDAAVCRDDFRFQERGRAQSVFLREAAKSTAVNEPCDAHGRAAAALHITSAARRDRVVDCEPPRAGFDGNRRLRSLRGAAANGDESVLQLDPAHLAGPDQQRVGRVRRALITVTATLDDEAQIVFSREIDRRNHVRRRSHPDGVGARHGIPCIHPAGSFRKRRIVADEIRVEHLLEEGLTGGAVGDGAACGKRIVELDEAAADVVEEIVPAGLGRPRGIARTHPDKWRLGSSSRRCCRAGKWSEADRSRGFQECPSVHCRAPRNRECSNGKSEIDPLL